MKDKIINEVRKIRIEIESEKKADWNNIEKYFSDKQKKHKDKLYKGKPKSLPARYIA
ncbi:MAG: hypothetical protein KAW88_05540 [Candidatus Cloacimonetes bacterium]|nr:hypothetical protein [Candidatus Cloacimonadota bacterium]